jgi:hypothetical protein
MDYFQVPILPVVRFAPDPSAGSVHLGKWSASHYLHHGMYLKNMHQGSDSISNDENTLSQSVHAKRRRSRYLPHVMPHH